MTERSTVTSAGTPDSTTPQEPTANGAQPAAGAPGVLPALSLPKGGGAIRGLGEKFGVNPTTGTGTLTVPIAASPGRSGFGPQLALSYDSGAGNGPFGFGWSLDAPAITRATDKGLPRYLDGDESDEYVLSGAENLVPILDANGDRASRPVTLHGTDYDVVTYRPRIEGLFSRIERWTEVGTGISHWRSISTDNVTTLYGTDSASRIVDPADDRHVFSWLTSRTFDDKGNLAVYTYVPENGDGVDTSQAHESNRNLSEPLAQRYLKRIRYTAGTPWFPDWSEAGAQTALPGIWHFELVFDYGDHLAAAPTPEADQPWPVRPDPFSSYRSGFEVRTYRRCERVLTFHHFEDEPGVGLDCLVRSTDFRYSDEDAPVDPRNPIYTFLTSVEQAGYRRAGAGYLRRAAPPLEFAYSEARLQPDVLTLDPESGANLPEGLDGSRYQFVDLNGEGLSGILAEHDSGWGYKRNLGPLNEQVLADGTRTVRARFGPREPVAVLPSLVHQAGGEQFLDLAGNGRLDVAVFDDPAPGFFERTLDDSFEPFRAFEHLPRLDWSDPNLKFVDLSGDGHADLLIAGDDVLTVYPSLGERGFADAQRIPVAWDERSGPRVVFADGTQTIHLADMSGDGLSDIVRVRNGDTCYWPNLGYGHFGSSVAMDAPPRFVDDERYDPRRVRLADIDGSGTSDLIYIADSGVHICFNRSGNSWAEPVLLAVFPSADNLSSVQVADLLGNGTACLVWSSPLPGVAHAPLLYVDLMGGQKPHLMVMSRNNLGAETRLRYAPSTRFYLEDEEAGRPWITRLPFPVHVVERVETYDWIGRSRFVSRYAYHHGYFDGYEREFRGFGMVEQWDTEDHEADSSFPDLESINWAAESWIPPIHTRTWIHTGAFDEALAVSRQFAGEYWVEPVLRPANRAADREAMTLPDTVLPPGLTPEETRQAYRALKGMTLRIEVYADDASGQHEHPYSVIEQNFTVRRIQGKGRNEHAVLFAHPRESITFNYERQPADPRVSHAMTLETDEWGNVLRSVAIGYPRRAGHPAPEPNLSQAFQDMLAHDQARLDISATRDTFTDAVADLAQFPNDLRAPMPAESITAELTGLIPAANRPGITNLFTFEEMDARWDDVWDANNAIAYEDVSRPDIDGTGPPAPLGHRVIQRSRVRYRRDDLDGLLPFGGLQPLALPGESYLLVLTPGIVSRIFGNRVDDAVLAEAGYVHLDGDANWWAASGQTFFSADAAHTPAQELAEARAHFFNTRRMVDPFGAESFGTFEYDLVAVQTVDPLGNTVSAEYDFRVLQPFRVTDPNGNRVEAAFDALGMVTANAVRGKAAENLGDELSGFSLDLDEADLLVHLANPLADPASLIGNASARTVYDQHAWFRTREQPDPLPPAVYSLAREKHVNGADPAETDRFQHAFAYSDGFGREIQRKAQAEPGAGGQPRWVGTGWTIFNNKGDPVRSFEPFFAATHAFEFANAAGVASTLFYDPVGRVVATLHPDNTWEKVVFDNWRQETWDVNDIVLVDDPRTDPDVGDHFQRLLGAAAFTSWRRARLDGTVGDTPAQRAAELNAADKAEDHAGTTTVTHLDARGQVCLTVASNGGNNRFPARIALDAEGKPLATIDPRGRRVTEQCLREPVQGGGFRYVAGYDVNGASLYSHSMDGGERRTLSNIRGNPVHAWESLGRAVRVVYDALQRPTHRFLSVNGGPEALFERSVYGEAFPDRNLRGKLWRQYDCAGVSATERYDFKGNLLEASRQLAQEYRATIDWQPLAALTSDAELDAAAAPFLVAADRFVSTTIYDALNRPIQLVTPHAATMRPSVIRQAYNDASLPETLDAWIRPATAPASLLDLATADRHVVTSSEYNAKGQRTRLALGNGTVTTFAYNPLTFRLAHLRTARPASFPANERVVQDLFYALDPSGNITRIRDEADTQNVIYFRNQRVDPTADYTYDALYRLVRATGREHLGLTGGALNPPGRVSNDDLPRMRIPHRGDGNAVASYTETYGYDETGNLLEMVHQVSSGSWTRAYTYTEPSLIDPAQQNNRLSTTGEPGNPADTPYRYDGHGNMARMPHLPALAWDELDRLRSTTRQVVNVGTPETTWYASDAGGQRLRKVTDRAAAAGANPTRRMERISLGPIELWRAFSGDGIAITIERETLHLVSGTDRIAFIETRTVGADPGSTQLDRYQYGTHLGSTSLELDDQARIISYEEYFPFGATAYQAVQNQAETPKRHRHSGKERDEESDLAYHGARYYAAWLGRWTAGDPSGTADGLNLYAYCRNNPIVIHDPTGKNGKKKKPQAQFGDIKPHRKQGSAIPGAVKRLSEHEHIRARINLVLQTLDPETGTSPYTKGAYGRSATLTIPEDMARAKTKLDLALRDQLKEALDKGVIDDKLVKELDVDADIKRTVAARDATIKARQAAGQSIDDLKKITNSKITEAAHLQQSELFDVGKKQRSPIKGASDAEVDKALGSLDDKVDDAAKAAPDKAPVKPKTTPKAPKPDVTPPKSSLAPVKTGAQALETAGETGLKAGAKNLGKKGLKVIPFVGMGAGVASAGYEWKQGNYGTAALDAIGVIPVIGDLVDAGRLGVAGGEVLDAGLGISDVAAEHGSAVEGAAKWVGLGEDGSRVVGAIGAAASSITIAPTIAAKRKIGDAINWLLD